MATLRQLAVLTIAALASSGCLNSQATDQNAESAAYIDLLAAEQFDLVEIQSFDAVYAGDRLHLVVAGPDLSSGQVTIKYVSSSDGGIQFTEPVPVGTGQTAAYKPHRGHDIRLAVSNDTILVVWNRQHSRRRSAGPMVMAISRDGGHRFLPAENTSATIAGGQIYYVTEADDHGYFHLAWLDTSVQPPSLEYMRAPSETLNWSEPVTLDRNTCECCWTDMQAAPDGQVHILYRDQDPRDMRLISSPDHGQHWQAPTSSGDFNWQFQGCPHTGGAVATSTGDTRNLYSAVWTGDANSFGLWLLASENFGQDWPTRIRVPDDHAQYADLATYGDLGFLIWSDAGQRTIRYSQTVPGSSDPFEIRSLRRNQPGASHPKALSANGHFIGLWTEHAQDGLARLALARIPAEPPGSWSANTVLRPAYRALARLAGQN